MNPADVSTRIRFSGFGGQGIVLAGQVYGHAAAIAGLHVLQTQSYGSEARGGMCHSDVSCGTEEIVEVAPESFDLVVALSPPAYDRFHPMAHEGGLTVFEADLVTPEEPVIGRVLSLPATRLATERLGRRIFANVVTVGFVVAVAETVEQEAAELAIRRTVSPGTLEANIEAFRLGLEEGRRAI